MKTKNLFLTLLIGIFSLNLQAQEIGLNYNGILFPNLTTAERNAAPAELGIVIFNVTTNRFEYYNNNSNWVPLDSEFNPVQNKIEDSYDADSYIEVLDYTGSDFINMKVDGASGSIRVKSGPSGDLRIETVNFGTANTFIGDRAGDATTSDGVSNTFMGYQAGSQNISGSNNAFFGRTTGFSNETGDNNTFIGRKAGYDNIAGIGNTFVGAYTAENGENNFNTVVGSQAFQNMDNSTDYIVAMGYQAGENADQASNSVLIGHQAGQEVNDINNVLIGYQAGQNENMTNGNMKDNVIIGYQAGQENDGSANVYLGKQAGLNNQGTGNIFIGNNAGSLPTNASNQLRITNANSNVYEPLIYGEMNIGRAGINNDSPLANLHVKQFGLGIPGIAIENNSDADTWDFEVGANDLVLSFNGSDVGSWDDVSGAYTTGSDIRLKRSIQYLKSNHLEKILQLAPSCYYYKADLKSEKKSFGFIAQEVQEIYPEAVNSLSDEGDILGIDYNFFSVIAIQAIKEQQSQIEDLKKVIRDKEDGLANLEKRLAQIEVTISNLNETGDN